jgi:O-antigen ligase
MATNAGVAAFPAYASSGARSTVNVLVRATLYLFILSIPFEMPKNRVIPMEIPTLTGALFLLTTVLSPSACYRKIPGAMLWFVGYLWMFGLSTLVNSSVHQDLVLPLFLLMLQLVWLLWVMSNVLRDATVMRGALITIAFAVMVRAALQVLGIGATAHVVWTGGERITAFGQNANLSAIILSVGAVTLLNLRPRIVTWPIAALTGLAIIQTGSRGGLICLTLGVLVWAVGSGQTLKAKIRGVFVGAFVLAALAFGVLSSDMLRTRLLAAAEEGSLAGREHIYPAALSMISEKPVLGWGPIDNQFEIGARIEEEKKDRRDAHNIVLDLMTSTGFLGAIPFLIGYALCARAAWRARRSRYGILPLALMAVTFMGCMSGTWIASKILWFTFSIALAAAGTVPAAQRLQARPYPREATS